MNDITAIILTKNEEINIVDCINSIKSTVDRIVVVDSGSTDNTVSICKEMGAEVFYHEWKHYADQFNWALSNVDINTKWVLRFDADERMPQELSNEIIAKTKLHSNDDVNAFIVKFKLYFMGKYLKHSGSVVKKITAFKYGTGRFDYRAMGEHIVLDCGKTEEFDNYCLHHDCKGISDFVQKHNLYSDREVIDYYERKSGSVSTGELYDTAKKTQKLRDGLYYKLPKFMRAKLYYWYRFYGQLGFLDGYAGRVYCFIQAYMYRYIVDAKILESELKDNED